MEEVFTSLQCIKLLWTFCFEHILTACTIQSMRGWGRCPSLWASWDLPWSPEDAWPLSRLLSLTQGRGFHFLKKKLEITYAFGCLLSILNGVPPQSIFGMYLLHQISFVCHLSFPISKHFAYWKWRQKKTSNVFIWMEKNTMKQSFMSSECVLSWKLFQIL